jgi:hypothetical protein
MDLDFKLYEQEVLREDLIIHNQKTKRALSTIKDNHQYFEKRIIWDLIKAEDIRFYSVAELEQISEELYQLAYNEVKDFDTLGNQIFIKQVLDRNNCFVFKYQPNPNDIIMLSEVYRFNSLKNINRSERIIKRMQFIYINIGWTLFEQEFRCSKIFKSGLLISKTAQNSIVV